MDDLPIWEKVVPCNAPRCLAESFHAYTMGVPFMQSRGVTKPGQTFANFDKIKGTADALKYAKAMADGSAEFIFLLIFGGTGNGKTHLCNAVMHRWMERALNAEMVKVPELFSHLRSAMGTNTTERVLQKYKDIFCLALDDWGVEIGSLWEQSTFDDLMTTRFDNGRPTVLTTNKDISELSPRLKSRFEDVKYSRIALNSAGDYRKNRR